LCSTPFGIIGIFTEASVDAAAWLFECSTPFGIIGIFTFTPVGSWNTYTSAQRLSASLESSPCLLPHLALANLCSTPFGIIGIFTYAKFAERLYSSMCSTPFGIIGIFTATQRGKFLHKVECSTPFGIIGIFTKQEFYLADRA